MPLSDHHKVQRYVHSLRQEFLHRYEVDLG